MLLFTHIIGNVLDGCSTATKTGEDIAHLCILGVYRAPGIWQESGIYFLSNKCMNK